VSESGRCHFFGLARMPEGHTETCCARCDMVWVEEYEIVYMPGAMVVGTPYRVTVARHQRSDRAAVAGSWEERMRDVRELLARQRLDDMLGDEPIWDPAAQAPAVSQEDEAKVDRLVAERVKSRGRKPLR